MNICCDKLMHVNKSIKQIVVHVMWIGYCTSERWLKFSKQYIYINHDICIFLKVLICEKKKNHFLMFSKNYPLIGSMDVYITISSNLIKI